MRQRLREWWAGLGLRHVQGVCLIVLTLAAVCYVAFPRYRYEQSGGHSLLRYDRWTGEVRLGSYYNGTWTPIQRP